MDTFRFPFVRRWIFSPGACLLLAVSLATGLLLLLFGSLTAQAAPICNRYVFRTAGADVGTCSDKNKPCKTISYALRQAVSGDRICVASNSVTGPLVYPESLYVNKTVFLDGAWEASCNFGICNFTALACKKPSVTINPGGGGRVIKIEGKLRLRSTASTSLAAMLLVWAATQAQL